MNINVIRVLLNIQLLTSQRLDLGLIIIMTSASDDLNYRREET